MNYHYIIMVIKKLIESTPNSLNILGVGELTPITISTLTPVSVHEIENRAIHFKYLDAGLCLFAF